MTTEEKLKKILSLRKSLAKKNKEEATSQMMTNFDQSIRGILNEFKKANKETKEASMNYFKKELGRISEAIEGVAKKDKNPEKVIKKQQKVIIKEQKNNLNTIKKLMDNFVITLKASIPKQPDKIKAEITNFPDFPEYPEFPEIPVPDTDKIIEEISNIIDDIKKAENAIAVRLTDKDATKFKDAVVGGVVAGLGSPVSLAGTDGLPINPAKEDGNLADIKTNTDVLTSAKSGNSIGVSEANQIIDEFGSTTGWSTNSGADNLTTSTEHRGYGTLSLEFDKVTGDTDALISKTITSFDMSAYTDRSTGHMMAYLSSLTNVSKVYVRMGTDSSNYFQWDFEAATLSTGWTYLTAPILEPTSQTGDGADYSAITYIAYGVEFNNASDTLADIRVCSWFIVRTFTTALEATLENTVKTPFIAIKDRNSNTKLDVASGTYNYLYSRNTDGSNLSPVMDSASRPGFQKIVNSSGSNIDPATKDDNYPSGTGSNGSVTLTSADTAYAVPSTASTSNHVLILYNGSDTDMYWGYQNSNSNGILLASGKTIALNLGANDQVYAYCGSASKSITYTYKEVS